jgi:radical SAM protein with 4Fe4S-binding SPASM domain
MLPTLPFPRHITWQACDPDGDPQRDLLLDEVLGVITRLRADGQWLRILQVDLRRRRDIPEVVRHAASNGLSVQILARSGALPDSATLATLASAGASEVAMLNSEAFAPACKRPDPHAALKFDERWGLCLTASGDLTPDPAIPIVLGNVRTADVVDLYQNHPVLRALREPDAIEGKCGACPHRFWCGGSRARAYAATGSLFASDPACTFVA